jgi:hypothetical protein
MHSSTPQPGPQGLIGHGSGFSSSHWPVASFRTCPDRAGLDLELLQLAGGLAQPSAIRARAEERAPEWIWTDRLQPTIAAGRDDDSDAQQQEPCC